MTTKLQKRLNAAMDWTLGAAGLTMIVLGIWAMYLIVTGRH